MCHRCDYARMMTTEGLEATANRLKVLEVVGGNTSPLSAQQIYETLNRSSDINRVTVYRILNLLVEKGLIERISSGDLSHRYGLSPNDHHQSHAHFYCKHCGNLECLHPGMLHLEMESLKRTFPGVIQNTQIRIDGICKNCLKL